MTDDKYAYLQQFLPSLDTMILALMEGHANINAFHVEMLKRNKENGDLFSVAFKICLLAPEIFDRFCEFLKEKHPEIKLPKRFYNNDGEDDGN